MANKYYDLSIEIWEEPDGTINYSVIQNFSEKEDDHEVIAYGEAESFKDAAQQCRNAVFTVLE